jgi:hypothetical protein
MMKLDVWILFPDRNHKIPSFQEPLIPGKPDTQRPYLTAMVTAAAYRRHAFF